jgi:hypothetical protein
MTLVFKKNRFKPCRKRPDEKYAEARMSLQMTMDW